MLCLCGNSQSDISSAQRPAALRTRSVERLNAENTAGRRIVPLPPAAFIAAVDRYERVAAARFQGGRGRFQPAPELVAGSVNAVT